MRGTRVFVATTEGPSEIQKIAEEDPEVPSSVVCLNGTSTEAGISRAYNSFVKRPTGIIEKYFGHRVFRVDVSDRISDGSSWQLPLTVAHALFKAGRLASPRQAAERAVWLTGQVGDPEDDLSVQAVDHVADKLRQSGRLFASLKAQSVPVTVFVPRANLEDIDDTVRRDSGLAITGVKVVGVDSVDDVLGALKIPALKAAKGNGRKRSRVGRVAALVALLLLFGGAVGAVHLNPQANAWFRGLFAKADNGAVIPDPKPDPTPRPEPEPKPEPVVQPNPEPVTPPEPVTEPQTKPEPKPEPVSEPKPEPVAVPPLETASLPLEAVEGRTPSGRACVGGGVNLVDSTLAVSAENRIATSRATGLCRIRYVVTNRWEAPVHAWLYAAPVGRERRFDRPTAVLSDRVLAVGETLAVDVGLARWVRTAITHRILLVAVSDDAKPDLQDAVKRDMADLAQDWEPARWSALRERLGADGVVTRSIFHEIAP